MSAELRHVVNGWLSSIRGRESAPSARDVAVPTALGLRRSLYTATTSLSSATVRSLQKKLRDAGFKGAVVEPLLRSDGGGFTVQYDGQEYKFWIDEAKMRSNGRGLYHGTGVSKNDMVLHQDHRGRWRVDLVTSAGGNHTDITGPPAGYPSAAEAAKAAHKAQHTRGDKTGMLLIQDGDGYTVYSGHFANGRRIGKLPSQRNEPSVRRDVLTDFMNDPSIDGTHTPEAFFEHDAWWVQCNCGAQWSVVDTSHGFDFEQVSAGDESFHSEDYETNSRRTGILSDGTRVNVYHQPGSLDEYTVVPHSMDWDSMARGEMRSMLGLSKTGTGFSQWTEGQEGRHLGRKLAWAEVPEELKRHIEQRVVKEASMVANPRKKKLTYGDLPAEPGRKVLACPGCGEEYSAYRGDYFQIPDNEACVCGQCGTQMVLADRRPQRGPEPQEARTTPGNRAWDKAEDAGLVRMIVDSEQENYFDVYGEPDTEEERQDIIDQIDRDGLNMFASQYRKSRADEWETAGSIGMIIGDLADSGYEDSLKEEALEALKNAKGLKGHKRNARGSTVDEHAKRELELYIENEYALIGAPSSKGKSIDATLRRKLAGGKYDPALAPKLWQYLVDEGAQRYLLQFRGSPPFNAATRRAVAAEFAQAWEAENLKP